MHDALTKQSSGSNRKVGEGHRTTSHAASRWASMRPRLGSSGRATGSRPGAAPARTALQQEGRGTRKHTLCPQREEFSPCVYSSDSRNLAMLHPKSKWLKSTKMWGT